MDEEMDFHAELMMTWANQGPEAAKAMLEALDRKELKKMYMQLFMKFFELAVENDRLMKELVKQKYGN